jgi:hypothetical protein
MAELKIETFTADLRRNERYYRWLVSKTPHSAAALIVFRALRIRRHFTGNPQ